MGLAVGPARISLAVQTCLKRHVFLYAGLKKTEFLGAAEDWFKPGYGSVMGDFGFFTLYGFFAIMKKQTARPGEGGDRPDMSGADSPSRGRRRQLEFSRRRETVSGKNESCRKSLLRRYFLQMRQENGPFNSRRRQAYCQRLTKRVGSPIYD